MLKSIPYYSLLLLFYRIRPCCAAVSRPIPFSRENFADGGENFSPDENFEKWYYTYLLEYKLHSQS
jgi:hypothetical protein